jgi:Peptidase family M23
MQQFQRLLDGRWLTAASVVAALGLTAFALLFHDLTSSGSAAQPPKSAASTAVGRAANPIQLFGSSATPAPVVVAPPAPESESPYTFIWPADYPLVQGMWAGHPLGIDIGVPYGQPVKAVRAGHVIFAGGDKCCNYGLFVIVQHDDGFASLYGHFSRIDVTYGQDIRQGEQLGLSGDTGKAFGPHVHFELHLNGSVVDPLKYLEPRVDWTPTGELIAELKARNNGDGVAQQSASAPALAAADAPAPTPIMNHLDAATAMLLGANALAHQETSAYELDPMSCTAAQSGPNWWVTCMGSVQGCRGPACVAQLSTCVFDQPRLIAAACP